MPAKDHPNTVRLRDMYYDDRPMLCLRRTCLCAFASRSLCIVMDYLEGGDLDQAVVRHEEAVWVQSGSGP